MPSMKPFLQLIILCLLILPGLGCEQKNRVETAAIRIGIDAWPGYAYARLAQAKGFFAKNGVQVELVTTKNTVESGESYARHELDGFFGLFSDTILANANGIPARFVYVVDHSTSADAIVARPAIASLRELKGKTVSFEGLNTFSHIFVLKSLEKVGLNETNVRFKSVAGADVLKALENGEIDAGHTWDPTRLEATDKGYRVLAVAGEVPGVIIDGLVLSPRLLGERPAEARGLVKALVEAREYLRTNEEEAIGIMAKGAGITPEAMKIGLAGSFQYSLADNLHLMASEGALRQAHGLITDFLLTRGQMSLVPPFDQVVEPRLVNELAAKAGPHP